MNEYICDETNQLENVEKIRNMTDEEFEIFIKSLEEKQKKD